MLLKLTAKTVLGQGLFLRFGIHFKETVEGAVCQVPPVKLPPDEVFLAGCSQTGFIEQGGSVRTR